MRDVGITQDRTALVSYLPAEFNKTKGFQSSSGEEQETNE